MKARFPDAEVVLHAHDGVMVATADETLAHGAEAVFTEAIQTAARSLGATSASELS